MTTTVSVDLARSALRSPTFPKDWTQDVVHREVRRYELFLDLARRHPNQPLAPTARIDEIWHLHMTHPRAYYEDCQRLYGDILDHDGGFGSDPSELPLLQETFDKTAKLWEQEFGEPYVASHEDPRMTNCWHDCQSRCWHACKSKKTEDTNEQETVAR